MRLLVSATVTVSIKREHHDEKEHLFCQYSHTLFKDAAILSSGQRSGQIYTFHQTWTHYGVLRYIKDIGKNF